MLTFVVNLLLPPSLETLSRVPKSFPRAQNFRRRSAYRIIEPNVMANVGFLSIRIGCWVVLFERRHNRLLTYNRARHGQMLTIQLCYGTCRFLFA